MSTIAKVKAFKFQELEEKYQDRVIHWLDEAPLEYMNEEGKMSTFYFSEWDIDELIEHCEINGYLFDQYGNPIHHLILEEA